MDFVGTRHLVVPITIVQGVRDNCFGQGNSCVSENTQKKPHFEKFSKQTAEF